MEELQNVFSDLDLRIERYETADCYFVAGFLGGKENERSVHLNSFKRNLDRHYNENENQPVEISIDQNDQRELKYYYQYNINDKKIYIKARGYFEMFRFSELEEITSVIMQLAATWKEVKKSSGLFLPL
jgi:hypothetical protein